jgi:hypothetical protein
MLERTRSRSGKNAMHLPGHMVSGVREFEKLNHAVEAAKLKVPIAEADASEQVARAHPRFAEGHVLGKIVLRVDCP